MNLKRTEDLKAYILQKHSGLNPKKFDIIKVGVRIYIYFVGHDGLLHRRVVFRGCLPTIDGVPALQKELDRLIEIAIQDWESQKNVNK